MRLAAGTSASSVAVHRSGYGAGLLAGLAAVVMWGAQFPVAKSTFVSVDAFHATALRYAVPSAVLVAWLLREEGRAAFRYERRGLAAVVLGLVGMCASPAFVFGGLMLTRPEVAAILIATQPAMTALAQWLVRGARPPRFTLACIAVAFAGVVAVVTRPGAPAQAGASEWLGDASVLMGAVCWVVYTMGLSRFADWSTLRTTTLTMLPGTLGNLLVVTVAVAAGWLAPVGLQAWGAVAWQLAYLALAGVLAGMLCWNAAAQRIGALDTMLLLNLVPVVAFAIRFARGGRFAVAELAGAALVVGALVANNVWLRIRQRAPR